ADGAGRPSHPRGNDMSDDRVREALDGLRVRVPETAEDAAALRAEVQAADAALGELLRRATTRDGGAA
ncbi:hypothetical protein, partial [Microbacterium sp. NPDC057650]|uniref:hypothetical protein n=2 Tax=unclassified Microbacterium TaxID=2609290 RepID=UPI00366E1D8A